MKKLYQEKYFVCVAALQKLSPNKIVFNDAPSGLNILLQIHTRLSEKQLIRRALEKGIVITPASGFYYDTSNIPSFPQVLLEFGNIPLSEIEVVIAKLDKAWFD
jgi:GntR family transcriptional regulator/MocR family aminotransferase